MNRTRRVHPFIIVVPTDPAVENVKVQGLPEQIIPIEKSNIVCHRLERRARMISKKNAATKIAASAPMV